MKHIACIIGTRPEAIKMAPLVLHLLEQKDDFRVSVCSTGQHRELLDEVLQLFGIEPDRDLATMTKGQTLDGVTTKVLCGVGEYLDETKPDIVLVHGDTTTSMAAAMAAFYRKIAVGHVEAGLRAGDIYSPWPEEMNRQITGRIASHHFCPTETSADNLCRENVDDEKILVTGNTVIDALHWVSEQIDGGGEVEVEIVRELGAKGLDPSLRAPWQDGSRRLVLITAHRRENFGEGIRNICGALIDLATAFPDVDFVYPVHPNPNVREVVAAAVAKSGLENLRTLEPVNYFAFVALMNYATLLLTDSGGVQEEAPSLGKPVLVLRDNTERPEAIDAGTVKMVGTERAAIVQNASELLTDADAYAAMSRAVNPYGDGKACGRIANYLRKV